MLRQGLDWDTTSSSHRDERDKLAVLRTLRGVGSNFMSLRTADKSGFEVSQLLLDTLIKSLGEVETRSPQRTSYSCARLASLESHFVGHVLPVCAGNAHMVPPVVVCVPQHHNLLACWCATGILAHCVFPCQHAGTCCERVVGCPRPDAAFVLHQTVINPASSTMAPRGTQAGVQLQPCGSVECLRL